MHSVYGDSVLAAQRRVSRRQVDGAEALQPPALYMFAIDADIIF